MANLLPIGGGFKGYAIGFLIEVLTGALVQSLLSTEQAPGWHPAEYGCLVLAMDIDTFTDNTAFKTAVSELCRNLRAQVPAAGVDQVAIPGDRGHAKVKMALETGKIQIEDTLMQELTRLSPSTTALNR